MRLLRGACAHLPSPPLGSLGPDLLRPIRISVGFELRAQVDRLDDEVGGGNLQRQFGQLVPHRAKVISDHLYERESALLLYELGLDQTPRQARWFLQNPCLEGPQQVGRLQCGHFLLDQPAATLFQQYLLAIVL